MKVIPYVEIISPSTFLPIQIIEPKECWFELGYNEVGEFELYAPATRRNLDYLQKGNFIKIPNLDYIWVITSIEYTFTAGGSRMISAKGYESIWLLKKGIIYDNLKLSNTITAAFVRLVNIFFRNNYANGYTNYDYELINIDTVLNETVAPRGNLLEYIHKMAKSYGCNINTIYGTSNTIQEEKQIKFRIRQGQDLSETVKFSQSNDNLLSFHYLSDDEGKANDAYVVAKVNDVEYTTTYATAGTEKNTILVESSLTNKYTDTDGNEVELDLTKDSDKTIFINLLKEEGKLELANHTTLTEIKSTIDLKNSKYEFEKDYMVGDIVEVKDEFFNITAKQRIVKYTIRLESTGIVTEELEFGE